MFTYEIYANDIHLGGLVYEKILTNKELNSTHFDVQILMQMMGLKSLDDGDYTVRVEYKQFKHKIDVELKDKGRSITLKGKFKKG